MSQFSQLVRRLAILDQQAQALQEEVARRKRVEVALRESENFLLRILESSPDSIKVLDIKGDILQINPAGRRHLDVTDAEQIIGRPWVSYWADAAVAGRAIAAARNGEVSEFQGFRQTLTGTQKWWDVKVAPITGEQGVTDRLLVIARDSTATRMLTERLAYDASHDSLTDLVNRNGFERTLNARLQSAAEEERQHALLYIDLDQFKIVNDTCGHAAGDELLRQLSRELKGRMRESDILARLGGDEFAALLEDCPPADAERIAHGLLGAIKSFRFHVGDRVFSVSASIGVVNISRHNCVFDTVMAAADSACYLAKEQGRDRVSVYREDSRELQLRRREMSWVARIKEALQWNQLCLYRQRIVPLSDLSSTGNFPVKASAGGNESFEILLRIENDDGDSVAPMAFIPAAERYNLMPEVDRWVVRATLSELARSDKPVSGYRYSINLSAASLNDAGLLEFISAAIREQGIAPQAVCFEIKEAVAVNNLQRASEFIAAIRELGCSFALDNFGGGPSSFSCLKNLAVNYLKIDASFIQDLDVDPATYIIVKAINDVAHGMGIKTIAESVDNQAALERLGALGVDYVQGYYLHRPEPFPVSSAETGPVAESGSTGPAIGAGAGKHRSIAPDEQCEC